MIRDIEGEVRTSYRLQARGIFASSIIAFPMASKSLMKDYYLLGAAVAACSSSFCNTLV